MGVGSPKRGEQPEVAEIFGLATLSKGLASLTCQTHFEDRDGPSRRATNRLIRKIKRNL